MAGRAMAFKDHFSRLAAQYSAFRPAYPPTIFDYLVQLCRERQSVWDCACGNGQATVALAELFEGVIATDASPQQLAAAPARANVTYRVARAEESGIEANSVDLVTVAQALHWFDLDTFYGEVQRVLKPSGLLAVWTYGPMQVDDGAIDAHFQEFYRDTVGPYWPPERRFVESGYRGLAFPFAEISPPPFNMEERWERAHLLGYLRTWSATARYVDDKGVDPVAELEERIRPLWIDAHSTRRVTWPLALRVGRKR
jgi:ubiquinone/menaquinone biosynthesis C-methylase UbiE